MPIAYCRLNKPDLLSLSNMKLLKPNQTILFNPPLRIFKTSGNDQAEAQPTTEASDPRFERPKMHRLIRHERVARYFTRRGFSFGSPLN